MVSQECSSRESITTNIKVMAVAENRLGALLLGNVLSRFPGCDVVCSSADCGEASAVAASTPVDLAVINQDLESEPLKGLHFARLLSSSSPNINSVLLVTSATSKVVAECFQSGARGIFHEGEPLDALWDCICQVHQGKIYASQADVSHLVQALIESPPLRLLNANGKAILTNREQLVAQYVTEGYTNREIAKKLQLSEHTVKNYIFRIFDRLGVSSRAEMIFYVLGHRLQAGEQEAAPADNKLSSTSSSSTSYLKRAQEGCPSAQYRLGEFYNVGQGVPKDQIASYMWLTIAEKTAALILELAGSARKDAATRMTSSDIAAAQTLAVNWTGKSKEGSYERKRSRVGHTASVGALGVPAMANAADDAKLHIAIPASA